MVTVIFPTISAAGCGSVAAPPGEPWTWQKYRKVCIASAAVNVWSNECGALLIPESHFAGVEVVEWAIAPGAHTQITLVPGVIVTLFGENWLF